MLKNYIHTLKALYLPALILLSTHLYAQVGINTTTPSTMLDARSVPGNTSLADGILPPSITGNQLQAKTYGAAQEGTLVYVSSAATVPAGQAINVSSAGFYVFNGSTWEALETAVSGIFVPVVVASGSATPDALVNPPLTTNTYTFGAGSLTTLNGDGLSDDTSFTATTNGTYSFEISLHIYDIESTANRFFYGNSVCLSPCSPEGLVFDYNFFGIPPRDDFRQLRSVITTSFSVTMSAGDTIGPLTWQNRTDPTFTATSNFSDLKIVVSRVAP